MLTGKDSGMSMYQKEALIGGFYSYDQLDILEPFFDRFFDVIQDVHQNSAARYFERFLYGLLPKMIIKESHIVKLAMMKSRVPDNDSKYMNNL